MVLYLTLPKIACLSDFGVYSALPLITMDRVLEWIQRVFARSHKQGVYWHE